MRTFSQIKFNKIIVPVLVMAVVAVPALVQSQDVANGSATATILAALQVTGGTLAFGNVYQGVAKSIANNNAAAGVFTITGAGLAVISLYMQLPEYLQGPSNDRMVIAFSTTDASVDSTGNVDPTAFGTGWQNTNPHAFPATTSIGGGGTAAIFLGGKVVPSVNQTAGAYSGDIVLTVSYTGV